MVWRAALLGLGFGIASGCGGAEVSEDGAGGSGDIGGSGQTGGSGDTGSGDTGGSRDTGGSGDVGGEPGCTAGTERCSCYGNGTCNDGLSCYSNLCVLVPETGGAGATPGGGGSSAAGGSSEGGGAGGVPDASGGVGAIGGSSGSGPGGATSHAGAAGSAAAAGAAGAAGAGCRALSLVFIIDRSGSMGSMDVNGNGIVDEELNEWDHTAERWVPLRDALIGFFNDPGAAEVAASLEFFPTGGQPTEPSTGVCSEAQYAAPAVLLQSLADVQGAALLVNQLESVVLGGGTPTLPALHGALQYAETIASGDPASTAVVLFTDGEPGVARVDDQGTIYNEKCFCYGEPACPDEDEMPYVAQAAADAASRGIATHVIGMGEIDPTSLDLVAASGGTERARIVPIGDPAATRRDLLAVLRGIAARPGC